MSETHYSGSKQRFMSARTYYRRTADEQNAAERELEESPTLFIGLLTAFTLLSAPPTFPWFVSQLLVFPEPFFFLLPLCPSFILCSYLPLSSFPLIQVSTTLSNHTHTHTYACLRQSLGILSMQPWYRCPTASQTANITEQTCTVHPGHEMTSHSFSNLISAQQNHHPHTLKKPSSIFWPLIFPKMSQKQPCDITASPGFLSQWGHQISGK